LRPEVVLSFTIKCNLYTGLCRRVLPFHHIANVSGLGEGFDRPTTVSKVIRTLYRGALRRTDRIFFQNSEDLRLCATQGLVPPKNARLIPGSGVDLTQFSPSPFPLRGSGAPRTALIFGRLLPKKGFYDFLTAANVLKQRWGEQARFVVMGAPDPARPESVKLLNAIKSADAAGTITYLEPRDDVLPVLQQADVVVLPSTYNEGVPRSLLEALACAKPLITTDWRGCRDVVRDGKNGYLIQPNNLEALLQELHSILAAPAEQLHAMGRASRALAEECYDEQVVISAYLSALPGAAPSSASPSVSAPLVARS
jgi:glycosyltransferase involved in cell wall biosynthesis